MSETEEHGADIEVTEMKHDKPKQASAISPGSYLQQVREERGFSSVDVADQLRLPHHVIEAIEADDYKKLPNFTFVRGYLRSYAKFLDLSADQLIAQFNELGLEEKKPEPTAHKVHLKHTYINERAVRWGAYIVILVLAFLLITWWHSHSSGSDETIPVAAGVPSETENSGGASLPLNSLKPMTAEEHQAATKKLKELAPNFGAVSKKKSSPNIDGNS